MNEMLNEVEITPEILMHTAKITKDGLEITDKDSIKRGDQVILHSALGNIITIVGKDDIADGQNIFDISKELKRNHIHSINTLKNEYVGSIAYVDGKWKGCLGFQYCPQ